MSCSIELQGGGVQALQALAQRAGDTTLRSDNDATNVLSTAQLRHAATLLRRLRSEDPSTPTLAALLKQRGGVTVRMTSDDDDDNNDAATAAASKEHALYMERRRKKLLRLDEEMRYGRLVRNVKTKTSANELEQFQKSTRQHLSIGANMIAARVTAFVAMYMLGRTLTDNETSRVIIGLGGAIVMMVIEMVLFITRASKYEAIERQQLQQRPSVF